METHDTFGAEEWPARTRALRRLAEGLLRGGDGVEDLLQEAWLRSRGRPQSLPWWKTVLRNLARDRARALGRRAQTERGAARAEAVPGPAEIVAQLEVAESLAREVAALTEPGRTVVHLRFFEDLAPEAIAARTGVPLETVRTRLRRGLGELRARMDRTRGGERRAWVLALAPLARRTGENTAPGMSGAAAGGVFAMTAGKLAGGVAAAALAGWFLWGRGAEERRSSEAALVRPLETLAAAAATPSAPADLAPAAARESQAPASPDTSARAAGDGRMLDGRVVIVAEDGRELTGESGVLTLGWGTSEADASAHEVPFEDGRWSIALPDGAWLVAGRLLSNGREALLPEPMPVVPGDEPFVVRGRWLPRGRLRVLDAHTGAELAGVEVRCADGWRANPLWTHPGDDARVRTVVADAASPLELPERLWLTPYWVHAPGHAWERIDFDHRAGGERTVVLSPEPSAVRVTLAGAAPEGAFVRLYTDDPGERSESFDPGEPGALPPSWHARASVRANAAGATEIGDLQSGRYLAAVELGEYDARVRLGASPVELVPHATAQVVIALEPAGPDGARTRLHGTLRVPSGFARTHASLHAKGLEGEEPEFRVRLADLEVADGAGDVLFWDAGPRRAGTHVLTLQPLQFRCLVEVAGAATEFAFEVPPLVRVRVEVVDAASGESLAPERLSWAGPVLPGVRESTRLPMQTRGADGAFEFVAARGAVSVHASVPGYEEAERSLELSGESETCRIEMTRATAIQLALRAGEEPVPIDPAWASGVRLAQAGGTRAYARFRPGPAPGSGTFLLDEPGSYTLAFPPLAGFAPIESQAVEARSGETVELRVALVREP